MSEFSPVAYTSETRVSRKPHKCSECRGVIFYKEMYHYFAGCWDGSWGTFKTCVDCQEFRNEVEVDLHYDERPFLGHLYEDIYEYRDCKPILRKYVDICDKRGVKVNPEMRKMIR